MNRYERKSLRVAKQTRNAAYVNVAQNHVMIRDQRAQVEQAQREANWEQYAALTAAAQAQARAQIPAYIVPGWYPDPRSNGGKAYWDGSSWHLPEWDGRQWLLEGRPLPR